jgi:hypothetical protein
MARGQGGINEQQEQKLEELQENDGSCERFGLEHTTLQVGHSPVEILAQAIARPDGQGERGER